MFQALFAIVYLTSAIAQANLCMDLFSSTADRLEVIALKADETNAKLFIEKMPFSNDVNKAIIEMVRLLVQNSSYKLEDKNVLIKNKFTLAIPVKDGYVLELTYESRSSFEPRFILQDKIVLLTPHSVQEFKVTNELVHPLTGDLIKSEFDLKDMLPLNSHLKLKIPTVIQGPLIRKFAKMADYFEFFEKEQLAKIFKSDNLFKIESTLKLGRAKKVFFDVLIKEPFKMIIGGTLMFAVFNSALIFPDKPVTPIELTAPTVNVTKILDRFPLIAQNSVVRQQFEEIRIQAMRETKARSFSNLTALDVAIDPANVFSRDNGLFVFDKFNENTGSKHTYLAFTEEFSNDGNVGITYFLIEVNAIKYKNLIDYIKNQGHSLEQPIEKTK